MQLAAVNADPSVIQYIADPKEEVSTLVNQRNAKLDLF